MYLQVEGSTSLNSGQLKRIAHFPSERNSSVKQLLAVGHNVCQFEHLKKPRTPPPPAPDESTDK